jgi:hypothetical protein
MNLEYFCKKKTFDIREIEEAQIFFSNGDFFTLSKTEIVDVAITFYDELRVGESGFCPIAKSGFTQNDCDYISGYAQEQKDGSILIVFGK